MDRVDAAWATIAPDSSVLLIVPPFHSLYRPALGVHILQACARQAGFATSILYANLIFMTMCGERVYVAIEKIAGADLLPERLFAAAAFGAVPLSMQREELSRTVSLEHSKFSVDELLSLEAKVQSFCHTLAERIAKRDFAVVGASSTFVQTTASVALLSAVKAAHPSVTTIIGGANCEGEMAEGIASLPARIDHVFSGECEVAFPDFLKCFFTETTRQFPRIIKGSMCAQMDAPPAPNFSDYFAQLEQSLPAWRERPIWLSYETSRGCWWGQKSHCTFCGLNGEGMTFRQKSPDRVLADLRELLHTCPTSAIAMTDNIMPHTYFSTLLPRLAAELPSATIYYEQKANLSLEKVCLLERAGVRRIQPGIEALSSGLLRRMRKGVLARQNIALLRYCRSLGVEVRWNLLYDVPGDTAEDYRWTVAIVLLISHLAPPIGLFPISIERFSPYFNDPEKFGISDVKPVEGYGLAFPRIAALEKLAYHFEASFRSAYRDDPHSVDELATAVKTWISAWEGDVPRPVLHITPLDADSYLLLDTRNLPGGKFVRFLTEPQARSALVGGPVRGQDLHEWAFDAKLAVEMDGWSVPLAVADYETLKQFESDLVIRSKRAG